MDEEVKEKVETPVEQPVAQENEATRNFRELRDRADAIERRAAEQEKRNKELEAALLAQSQGQQQQFELVDDDIDDDVYIDGKRHKRTIAKLKKELEDTRKTVNDFIQHTTMSNAEMRLKNQFADFNDVVTEENLRKLAQSDPQMMRTILANNDLYDRGYISYSLLKSAGIGAKYNDVEEKSAQNKNRPRSSSSAAPQTGQTPLTQVDQFDRIVLSPEDKKRLIKMREDILKGR